MVETDIAECFSAIPHEKLMQVIEERISDQGVLKLLRVMLRAGVLEDGVVRRAQGGPVSPLLCNAYLHRLDRAWDAGEHGVLVHYSDDLVMMFQSREQADTFRLPRPPLTAELTDILGHPCRLVGDDEVGIYAAGPLPLYDAVSTLRRAFGIQSDRGLGMTVGEAGHQAPGGWRLAVAKPAAGR